MRERCMNHPGLTDKHLAVNILIKAKVLITVANEMVKFERFYFIKCLTQIKQPGLRIAVVTDNNNNWSVRRSRMLIRTVCKPIGDIVYIVI